jgi:hypothetical protein
MNKNTCQTCPKARTTKEDNAGLSLLQPTLFSFEGQVIKYYNETSKNTSDFVARLIRSKFLFSREYSNFNCALSYTHPRLYAAMYFFITGDRFYYDYHGFNY